jgi:hypothetical protein
VDGVDRTVVTLRLGAVATGNTTSLRTVTASSALLWTPSDAARAPDGIACSTAPVAEAGPADREF